MNSLIKPIVWFQSQSLGKKALVILLLLPLLSPVLGAVLGMMLWLCLAAVKFAVWVLPGAVVVVGLFVAYALTRRKKRPGLPSGSSRGEEITRRNS